jgi:nucleoside-diphosphate kinase
MKEKVLVILKPDAMDKNLFPVIKACIGELGLNIKAAKHTIPDRKRLEEHYRHIQEAPFFEDTINFMLCEGHNCNKLNLLVVEGDNAVSKLRELAGSTHPEDADANSLRGRFGREINGVLENVLHVSSSVEEGEREMGIWF